MASPFFDKRRSTWSVRLRWPRGRDGKQKTILVENEQQAKDGTANANRLLAALDNPRVPFSIPDTVENVPEWLVSGGLKGFRQVKPIDKPITISELVDSYLALRKSQADSGEISVAMYSDDKYQLEGFSNYCKKQGKANLPQVVTPDFLIKHKSDIRSKYSVTTLWHSVKAVKRLLTWGWKQEKLDSLPRNLDDYARVERPKPKPKFFTVEEINTMFASATPRMKLYILLALNGGYTQIDIATLTHEMIDWKNGIILRDRNKTNVPQGCKLWFVTLTLLRKEITKPNSQNDNLVFLSEKGNPLAYESVSTSGKHSKVDAVRSAFNRLKTKCKINDNRGFKSFRKTGAEMIKKQYQQMPTLYKLYLAQSLDTIGQAYTTTHFDEMYKATDWLATQFVLDLNRKQVSAT